MQIKKKLTLLYFNSLSYQKKSNITFYSKESITIIFLTLFSWNFIYGNLTFNFNKYLEGIIIHLLLFLLLFYSE